MTLAITSNDYQSLKSHITLSDVVGLSVKLHQAGTWKTGLCPFHKETNPSFAVNDSTGKYRCYGCGEHGDVFDWVAYTDGLDPETDRLKVFRRVQEIAGDYSVATQIDAYDPQEKSRKQAEDAEDRRRAAFKTWMSGKPIAGTKAEIYLREKRGIVSVDLSGMPFRFIDNHPYWTYCDVQEKPVKVGAWPALLTAIQEVKPNEADQHRFLALHTTWFDLDDPTLQTGKPKITYVDAAGETRHLRNKKVKGEYFGRGAIMLTPPAPEMGVTEGIENALTALELGPITSVWAAVAMNAMGTMPLPPECQRLSMLSDSDSKNADTAIKHQKQLSNMMAMQRNAHKIPVDLRPAPPGHDLNSWWLNELMLHRLRTGQ